MQKCKKIFSTIICCVMTLATIGAADNFLMRKTSYIKNADFYSYEDNYDILFLGSSHMVMGVSTMDLWADYGITSYNLGNYGQWIPVDYWVLKNALDYTMPKLVVVDVHAIGVENKYSLDHVSQMHEVFDVMPLSKNKVSAVYDLLPDGKRMEFLFDFSLYYTRWNEVDASFWDKVVPSTEKGANLDNSNSFGTATVKEMAAPKWIDTREMKLEETTGKEYLRKIIELCQNSGIEVMLVALPYAPTEEEQKNLNGVYEIADHRNDQMADEWNKDYEEYLQYKISWLKEQKNLDAYLMLLADDELDVNVEIYNTDIWKDLSYVKLFENLGVDVNELTSDSDYVTVQSGGVHTEVFNNFYENSVVDESMRVTVLSATTGELLDSVVFQYMVNEQQEGDAALSTMAVYR